MNEHKMIEMKV